MKKDELITAIGEVREGLHSDEIVKNFDVARIATHSSQQVFFSETVLGFLVEGAGNYVRFDPTAREICAQLKIASIYDGKANSAILHHIAQAKGAHPGQNHNGVTYRTAFLDKPETLLFVEAHRRVVTAGDLLDATLHATRPEGELLLEGVSTENEPTLDRFQQTLSIIRDLIEAYSEAQGATGEERVEVTYLDLGSNFQVGVKVDGKAETGINLTKFLTEVFRWLTNPRAYMRERRAEGMTKEIGVFADLQKRVDEGTLAPDAANVFAARLLGCGQKLVDQRVFPVSLIKERTTTSPATELLTLVNERAPQPTLPLPQFTSTTDGSTAGD